MTRTTDSADAALPAAPMDARPAAPQVLTPSDGGFNLQRILILGTLTFVTILYAMAVTIVNVALPDIRGALSATQDQVTWVVTANLIATAVATPIAGWAAGRFGVRRLMLTGTILFTLSSILCGMALSLESLVGFRILQGLSGAPLIPLSQAILLARFPKNLHNKAMAIWGMGTVLGPIIAPSVGGYLSEAYGWRWVFYLIVPFGIVATTGVWFTIRATGQRAKLRLDFFGFITLAIVVTALQLILDRGERLDWLTSPEIIIEITVLGLAFYLFIAHTFTSDAPFVRPGLFKDRNYTMGVIMLFIFGLLNFVPMVLFPPLLQEIRGFPPSVIGLLLAARGAGTLTGFTLLAIAS
jgi:DHA2 family multidrug resistance protein